MNLFRKIADADFETATRLGCPLGMDSPAWHMRNNAIANMARNKGWRVPPKALRTDAKGMTRGDRKREALAKGNAKIVEQQAEERLARPMLYRASA